MKLYHLTLLKFLFLNLLLLKYFSKKNHYRYYLISHFNFFQNFLQIKRTRKNKINYSTFIVYHIIILLTNKFIYSFIVRYYNSSCINN